MLFQIFTHHSKVKKIKRGLPQNKQSPLKKGGHVF